MKPRGGGAPQGNLAQEINKAFGDLEGFKSKFKEAATTQFGSGWAWLVADKGKLDIVKTGNAVNPLIAAQTPLLTLRCVGACLLSRLPEPPRGYGAGVSR